MIKKRNSKNKAFTLAEVLVTLAVIGIVAALTIPSLIKNYQEKQLKTAWKKIYSDLSRATIQIKQNNGGTLRNLCPANDDQECFRDIYAQYLRYAKICSKAELADNCWHNDPTILQAQFVIIGDDTGMVLNNGAFLTFDLNDTSIPNGKIVIDINGFKAPNTVNEDILMVTLSSSGNGLKISKVGLFSNSYYYLTE